MFTTTLTLLNSVVLAWLLLKRGKEAHIAKAEWRRVRDAVHYEVLTIETIPGDMLAWLHQGWHEYKEYWKQKAEEFDRQVQQEFEALAKALGATEHKCGGDGCPGCVGCSAGNSGTAETPQEK